jgi:hypothetical protein
VDTSSGVVSPWNPAADDVVDAIALAGDKLYVGGGFRTLGGLPRSGLGAIDAYSGIVTDWNPSPGGSFSTTVYALAASGSTVFVGGDFRSIHGEPRGFLAGVDASTGLADPSMSDADGAVWSLNASDGQLIAGGSFEVVGGLPRCGLVALPLRVKEADVAGIIGRPDDQIAFAVFPNPTRGTATLHYSLPARMPVTVAVYDVQGRVVGKVADHQVQDAGSHDLPLRLDGWRSGYYFCRFGAGGVVASRKLFVVR